MYIGVWAFGVNVRSNFILIRQFDWPYKKFIVGSEGAHSRVSTQARSLLPCMASAEEKSVTKLHFG